MKTEMTKGRGYTYLLPMRFIWTTRDCIPILTDELAEEVRKYIGSTASRLSVDRWTAVVTPDTVQIDALCRPQITPADAVKVFKGNIARWLFMNHPEVREKVPDGHLWNTSYYVHSRDLWQKEGSEGTPLPDEDELAYLEDMRKKAGIIHGKEI